jgi:lipopolysaccharide transport system permease protein
MAMRNLWDYRGLIKKLAVTDLKIRYKSSVLGIIWSLLQPLLMFLILYVVFGSFFNNRSIVNYPLFLLLGIISWGFFDKATYFSLNSISGKPTLVKKIYFPREILVISACVTALMMTILELVVFGIIMLALGVLPTMTILIFPMILLIEFIFAFGVSLALASLNVRYRDVQYIWAVVMQAGFFATPIMYSMTIFNAFPYIEIMMLNPIGVMIEMMRGVIIYDTIPGLTSLSYALTVAFAMLTIGLAVFNRMEPAFAEEV